MGYTIQEVDFELEAARSRHGGGRSSSPICQGVEFPHLAEHIVQHLIHEDIGGGDFEFGLERLLDGIERIRTESVEA